MQIENTAEQPKVKKKSNKKKIIGTFLLTFFSVIVVFVVWLFYPIDPPAYSLRGYLPESSAISLELHDLDGLGGELQRRELFAQLKQLPIWPEIVEIARKNKVADLEANYDKAVSETFRLLNESSLIHNRVKAIALSVLGIKGENFCAVLYLDNIGIIPFKLAYSLGPKSRVSNIDYVTIPLEKDLRFLGHDRLYLRLIPKSRIAVLSTISSAFINPSGKTREVETTYRSGKQKAVELDFNLPVRNVITPYLKNSGYEKFIKVKSIKGSAVCLIDNFTLEAEVSFKPGEKGRLEKTRCLALELGATPGLGISAALPDSKIKYLAGEVAKAGNNFKPLTDYFSSNATGSALLGFYPQTPEIAGSLGVFYSVADIEVSAKKILSALNQTKANVIKSNKDLLARMILESIKPQALGRLSGNVLLPGVSAKDTLGWDFMKTAASAQDKTGYGVLSVGEILRRPALLEKQAELMPFAESRLKWLHSADAVKIARDYASGQMREALGQFMNANDRKKFDEIIYYINLVIKTLDSLDNLDAHLSISGFKKSENNTINIANTGYKLTVSGSGKLRIK